jgi:hypothetical protein
MTMNVEAEIRDLKRRVGELEGSFGFLTQQIKGVHKDLLTFQGKTEQEFKEIRASLGSMNGRFDRVETSVRTLREDLPAIVADAVRPLLKSGNGKSRKT